MRCTKCGEVFIFSGVAPAAAAKRGRILVATDGAEVQSLICEVLQEFELRLAKSGEEAWRAIQEWLPQVALLDVGLPGTPAFELCDRVRAHSRQKGLGLILIASVFQQTRYKRAPTSLYGADDYIEKHHIRDMLPRKVGNLMPAAALPVGAPSAAPALAPPPATKAGAEARIGAKEQETLIREELYGPREEEGLKEPGGPKEAEGRKQTRRSAELLRENLRRYARIIVSDIALYNQELVERGIKEGAFYQVLKKELDEGHRLYLTRVPPAAGEEDYFQEAVREFIDKRKGGRPSGTPRGKSGHGTV